MFAEEASWIGRTLRALDLPRGAVVLDVGSSTAAYRHETQSHIEKEVLAPLRERGAELLHLDIKDDPGVDIVCDICSDDAGPEMVGRPVDLVLCNNTLVHVGDVPRAAATLRSLPAPGGHLLVTSPQVYRKVRDPLDNGFRPSPSELGALLTGSSAPDLSLLEAASVRIDDGRYYRGWLSRPSRHLVGGRWVPVPGFVEGVRRRSERLRWRVSCALVRRERG